MKKVISIVLNNFKNDNRVLKECLSLKKAGYDVSVIALFEKGLKEKETIQNIPVHRIKLKSRNLPKNLLVQLFKYTEFLLKVSLKYKDTDIVHCNDIGTLPIGVIMKKFLSKRIKVIYDAHEYETETNNLKGFRKSLVKALEKLLIKHADAVITVSNSIANEYVRLYNIKKPTLVLNTPTYKNIQKKNIFREKFNISEDTTIFLYQGGLTEGRGINIILEAFKRLSTMKTKKHNSKPVVVFMGYGYLQDKIKKASREYENIYFHSAVPSDVLLDYTSSADFGLSIIEDTCLNYKYCLPNKLFEYIMAEIPVVISNLPEMKKFVEKYKLGVVLRENTVDGLIEGINNAMNLNKERTIENIKKVKKLYNWENEEKKLLKVYSDLIK